MNANLQNLDEERIWEDSIDAAIHIMFENVNVDKFVNVLYEGRYKIYLHQFTEALNINDDDGMWRRGLSNYFKKRTDFPIKAGSGNKRCVLIPKFWVDEILKKPSPLVYDVNKLNDVNLKKRFQGEEVHDSIS